MESNDKLKNMNINKEILMTIVKNSGGRLVGDQEILEISEQQLSVISKELTKLFSIHSVVGQSEQCRHDKEPITDKDGFEVCPDCGEWGENC